MAVIGSIVSAIAGAFAGFGSFLGGLGFLGRIILGVGLQLAGNALAKKKKGKTSATEQSGTRLDVQVGGSRAREIGSGRFATAGQDIAPAITFGDENKTAAKIFLLSDFRIDGVNRIAINNIWCDLYGDNNDNDGRGFHVTGDTSPYVRIKLYYGTLDQQADPYLIANSGGRWTANHRGAGLAYAIVYVDYDRENMTSFPSLLFECRGVSYDPRQDSTVGGAGSQRFDDPSTWTYSDNPIVQCYTYERGFAINKSLIVGKAMPASDLPLSAWMAAMNVCDETIQSENNQKRYTAGTIFTSGDGVEHRDNLEPLLNACAGALVERVDGDVPLVGMTQPVVATLTSDDLIDGQKQVYQAKRSRSELVNAVFGSYNEPEKTWEAVSYPAQTSEAAQAADGERHAVQIDFRAVYSPQQAARLAQSALRENRYQASATIVVRPRWIVLEVGDWINYTHKQFGQKTYRVVGRTLGALNANGARNVTLNLQEVGAGMYDNSVYIPELPPVRPPVGPVFQQFPDNLQAVATVAEGEGTRRIPAIVVTWAAPTDTVTVVGVLIELWKTSEPERKIQFQAMQPQNSYTIVGGLLPHEAYSLRATVIPEPYRTTLWSQTLTLTMLDEEFDFDTNSIITDIVALNKWGNYDQRAIREEKEWIGMNAADASSAGYTESRSIKRDLSVSIGNVRAEYTELITVAVSETSALAARLESLEVEVNDNLASAFNELKVQIDTVDGKVTANAQAVTALNVKVDDVASSVTMRSQAVASPGGGWARWGVQVKTGEGDSWSTGAFYIDVQPGRSRIVMMADQVIMTDGSLTQQPFVFANGRLRLQAADIGDVVAGYIHSPDNTFIIDLTNKRIQISD